MSADISLLYYGNVGSRSMLACVIAPQIGIACERARHDQLATAAVVLSRANVVEVASREAQRLGIRHGESVTGARHRCSTLIVLPYDEACYRRGAEPIWNALATETNIVEPASPERCYAVLHGTAIYSRFQHLVAELSRSMPTSVHAGMGATKLVAYQAARSCNPGTVT